MVSHFIYTHRSTYNSLQRYFFLIKVKYKKKILESCFHDFHMTYLCLEKGVWNTVKIRLKCISISSNEPLKAGKHVCWVILCNMWVYIYPILHTSYHGITVYSSAIITCISCIVLGVTAICSFKLISNSASCVANVAKINYLFTGTLRN